jgi:hypothetical protein
MKLVDRYVAAIARELPQNQAEEIAAELRDALLSKIEDREGDLGRPLTEKEVGQLLIDFGHPLVVAGSYRKTQYLIGPDLFPMWFATMRFVLAFSGALLLLSVVVAAISANASPADVIQRGLQAFWPWFLGVFGVVTLVFAVNERMGKYRFKLAFNPRHLPPPRARSRKPGQIVSEMVFGALALLWWFGIIKFRAIMPIPAFLDVHLAPTWDVFRAPIAAYLVAEFAINGLDLMRPAWTVLNACLSLAKNLAGCALMGLVLQTGHWVEIGAPTLSAHVREMIEQGFDKGLHIGLMVTFVVLLFKAGADVLRLLRSLDRDGSGTMRSFFAG